MPHSLTSQPHGSRRGAFLHLGITASQPLFGLTIRPVMAVCDGMDWQCPAVARNGTMRARSGMRVCDGSQTSSTPLICPISPIVTIASNIALSSLTVPA